MYAIALSGGRQFKIEKNSIVRIPSLNLPVGEKLRLENILLFNKDGQVEVGDPYIEGAYAKARILQHGRHKKITIIKYKRRKDYRVKQGHRQGFTEIVIDDIVPGTKKKLVAKTVEKKVKKPAEVAEVPVEAGKAEAAAKEPVRKEPPAAKAKTPARKAEAAEKEPAAKAKTPARKAEAAEKEPAAKAKTPARKTAAAGKKPAAKAAAKKAEAAEKEPAAKAKTRAKKAGAAKKEPAAKKAKAAGKEPEAPAEKPED